MPVFSRVASWAFALLTLLATAATAQSVLVDTGPAASTTIGGGSLFGRGAPCTPQPSCASSYNYLAGRFDLTAAASLDSIQAWMGVDLPGTVSVKVSADSAGVPGTALFTTTYTVPSQALGWVVFSGVNPVLPAGSYWVSLEPVDNGGFSGTLPTGASAPLGAYAFNTNGNNRWVNFAVFNQNPAYGFRVLGTPSAATAAFGTAARAHYSNPWPASGESTQSGDSIKGAVGDVRNAAFFFSRYGTTVARGEIKSTGLQVGSYSSARNGGARGIAFRTYRNASAVAQSLRVNASVDGTFLAAPFGLPTGPLSAGAAIHVFESKAFSRVLAASGQPAGQFLLSSYALSDNLNPLGQFAALRNLFPGSLLADASKDIPAISFFPPVTPTSQSVTAILNTGFFTVPPQGSFTVMFDLTTGSREQVFPTERGYGDADFLNTLTQAPDFFTDQNGAPVAGIVAEGTPTPAPEPASLALVPATPSAFAGLTTSVTATATLASGAPAADVLVQFKVIAGPNTGVTGVVGTDASGKATFSYESKGGPGIDTITARSGSLQSLAVQVTWLAPRCPRALPYWAKNPGAWPVESVAIAGASYTKADLVKFLNMPPSINVSTFLAQQLVVARLNIASGSDRKPVESAILAADQLLSGFSPLSPSKHKPDASTAVAIGKTVLTLALYNAGYYSKVCTP